MTPMGAPPAFLYITARLGAVCGGVWEVPRRHALSLYLWPKSSEMTIADSEPAGQSWPLPTPPALTKLAQPRGNKHIEHHLCILRV